MVFNLLQREQSLGLKQIFEQISINKSGNKTVTKSRSIETLWEAILNLSGQI